MDNLKKLFKRRPTELEGYTQAPVASDVLGILADAGLLSRGVAPRYMKESEASDQDQYKNYMDREKFDVYAANLEADNEMARQQEQRLKDKELRDATGSKAFSSVINKRRPDLGLADTGIEGDDAYKLLSLDEQAALRRDLAAQTAANAATTRGDRNNEIQGRQDERMQEKLSKRIQDSGLMTLADSLDGIDSIMQGKSDIPGYGATGMVPSIALSSDGKKMVNLVQGLANIQLKERSGAAVTNQEMKRFLTEFGSGKIATDEQLKIGLQRIRKAMERDMDTISRGFSENVRGSYQDSEAYPTKSEGFTAQTQEMPKEKKSRLEELRAKKAGK